MSDFNPDNVPMHKRGVSLWKVSNGKALAKGAMTGIRPHEIEWLRDIVKQYDDTGKADRLLIYDNEASGNKSKENSPDFTIKRFSRPTEPGYKAEDTQGSGSGSDAL